MINGSNRSSMKKMISALALMLAAVMLLGAVFFTACGKKTDDEKLIEEQQTPGSSGEDIELTENQKKIILDAAEAFAEAQDAENIDFDSMTVGDFEKFVYYLYNDELAAAEGRNGFGTVSAEEADARLQSVFGAKSPRHTPRRTGMIQNYYCEDDVYYVRLKEKYAECSITGAEWTEDGLAKISVSIRTENADGISLEFLAELKDGGLTIKKCTRYDAI